MQNEKNSGRGKKVYNRIKYNPSRRPKLRSGPHLFEVVEISENELWLTTDNIQNLEKKISGELTLLDGDAIAIEGTVIWKTDNDIGLKLENLIPPGKLLKEMGNLISSE